MILKRISALAYSFVIALLITNLAFSADEYRKLGVEDLEMATGGTGSAETATSTGGVTSTKIDATHIKLRGSPGRTIEAELATKGTGSAAPTTTLPWDNITGKPSPLLTSLDNATIDNTIIGGTTPAAGTFTTGVFDNITIGAITDVIIKYLAGLSSNAQTQLNAKRGLDNGTFTVEVVATQFSSTGGDNTHFVQVSNSGTPSIPATDNAGMIWFSTADNTLKITNSTGAVGSVAVTW